VTREVAPTLNYSHTTLRKMRDSTFLSGLMIKSVEKTLTWHTAVMDNCHR